MVAAPRQRFSTRSRVAAAAVAARAYSLTTAAPAASITAEACVAKPGPTSGWARRQRRAPATRVTGSTHGRIVVTVVNWTWATTGVTTASATAGQARAHSGNKRTQSLAPWAPRSDQKTTATAM